MRKTVLYTLMSLDGDVDQPARYFTTSLEPGRHMFDEWSQYWPTSDVQPFADFINSVKKYVVTSTPLSNHWHNTEAVTGPIEDVVRDLKARPGDDIGIHDSIQLAQSLLAAGLVDELQLVVGPAIGFMGRRLFASTRHVRRLELLSATPTPSGSLLLAYRVP